MRTQMIYSLHDLLAQKRQREFLIVCLVTIASTQTVDTTSAQDINNENLTQYENSYLGIKFSYPPHKVADNPAIEPFGAEEGCFMKRTGCSLHAYPIIGSLIIYANSIDEPEFSKTCNCDTLEEYRNYYYEIMQTVFKSLAQMDGIGIGNYRWVNDNQTIIGNKFTAQQYEYLTVGKVEGKVSACDHTIRKHYGILTKVDKIFYRIEHDSCAKPEIYGKFFPEIKKIFDSVDFLPSKVIGSIVTSDDANKSYLDQTSASNSLEILSHNSFIDVLGFLHVVGEVKNNSPSQVEFVEIVATFYDSNNEVVGTKSTHANPSDLPGGDTAPFEILLTSASIPVSEIANYKLTANYR